MDQIKSSNFKGGCTCHSLVRYSGLCNLNICFDRGPCLVTPPHNSRSQGLCYFVTTPRFSPGPCNQETIGPKTLLLKQEMPLMKMEILIFVNTTMWPV